MPIFAFPSRYRSATGSVPPISPGVLSPLDDDTSPAFDPRMAQMDENQTPSPLAPEPPPIPKPPRDEDTMASASVARMPPLNPDAGPKASYAGLKELGREMPPPGDPAPAPPVLDAPAPVEASAAAPKPVEPLPAANAVAEKPKNASEKLQDLQAPEAPHSNWAQRLGMAVLSMTKLAPAAMQIMHPKWSEERRAYDMTRADLEAQQKEEIQAQTAEALGEQRKGTAEWRKAQAAQMANVDEERMARVDQQRQAAFQKMLGPNAQPLAPGEQPPAGWSVWQDPTDSNLRYARPSSFVTLPAEMVEFFPGRKAGDQISIHEYDQALQGVRQRLIDTNKADAKMPTNEAQLALAAQDPDPKVSGPAKAALNELAKQKAAGRAVNNIQMPYTPQQSQAANEPVQPGKTNEKFFSTLPPDRQRMTKAITEYRYPMPTGGFAMRDPKWKQAVDDAFAYDPSFDVMQYPVRQALARDFSSGNSSRNIRSLNTLVGHLGTLNQMALALNNRDMQTYNAVANRLAQEFGNPNVTNFDMAKTAVAGELSTAFKGYATDQEIRHWMDTISRASTPDQLKGAVETPLTLMASRLGAFNHQWEDTMGKSRDFISPEAHDVINRLAGGGGHGMAQPVGSKTVNMRAPDGSVRPVPADQVEHYKSRGAVVVQ